MGPEWVLTRRVKGPGTLNSASQKKGLDPLLCKSQDPGTRRAKGPGTLALQVPHLFLLDVKLFFLKAMALQVPGSPDSQRHGFLSKKPLALQVPGSPDSQRHGFLLNKTLGSASLRIPGLAETWVFTE